MNNFAYGQTSEAQQLVEGIVAAVEYGKTIAGKNGKPPFCTAKVTVNGSKYNLPFVQPGYAPCQNGDRVRFMCEQKEYEGHVYYAIDKKTFGILGNNTAPIAQPDPIPQPVQSTQTVVPKQTTQTYSQGDVQKLIVAQSSLSSAIKYHASSNAGEDAVLATMRKFADGVFNYALANNTQTNQNVVKTVQKNYDEDVPF